MAGTITAPGSGFSDIQALIFEAVRSAIFLLVILASMKHASTHAALAIPLTLVAIHLAAGAIHRRLGQSRTEHRTGVARGRPVKALDLPRRSDRRAIVAALIYRAANTEPVAGS